MVAASPEGCAFLKALLRAQPDFVIAGSILLPEAPMAHSSLRYPYPSCSGLCGVLYHGELHGEKVLILLTDHAVSAERCFVWAQELFSRIQPRR